MDHGRPPPGFCAGTLIATPEGPLPIEDFVPGDAVSLADGSTGTVWWIGMRDYLAAAFRDGAVAAVAPMCLKRDAWGVGRPARDLFVSPTLALDLDGVPILAALPETADLRTAANRRALSGPGRALPGPVLES